MDERQHDGERDWGEIEAEIEAEMHTRIEPDGDVRAEARFARAVGLDESRRWLPQTRRQIGRLLLENDAVRGQLVRAVGDRDRALQSLAAVKSLTVAQGEKIDRLRMQVNEQAAIIAELTERLAAAERAVESSSDGGYPAAVQRELDRQLSRSPGHEPDETAGAGRGDIQT